MREPEFTDAERAETLEELSDLMVVVQEMGRRLAYETHGDAYTPVQELNDLLHRARGKLAEIRALAEGT
ncbi:MAG: hypothetical protein IPO35_12945 [Uliginosibacterium sp.]|jgi:uncharacterized protein YfaS (alpha-2-macroglobulin family)|nr:hypothetical protein [Uliginosibacterium sp.]MBK9395514.1 hypothetical protein [Uliginosibacterium sp.]MBK9616357.1 hypothetical protein [Uliginosibacterium sp.]